MPTNVKSDFDRIYSEIIDLVSNKSEHSSVTKVALSERVREATGMNKWHIRMVIEGLVAAKVLTGNRSGRTLRITGVGEANSAKTDQLKAQVGKLEGNLTDLENKYTAQNEAFEKLKKSANEPVILKVQVLNGKKKKKEVTGIFHKKFKQILDLAQARKNIFIYGPTGSGKSFLCEQIADSLDLPYYFLSCTSGMSEGKVEGRLFPLNEESYIPADFVTAYENGGVFLLDEFDAIDPNVSLVVNSALASGRMSVPSRIDKPYAIKHKDFICVAAANTVGTGASRQYSGRNKLDGATLDRFGIGKVHVDYDPNVEEKLCPDDELRAMLSRLRGGIEANQLERAMSTRFMQDAYDMKEELDWDHNQILTAYFCGWREDEINKVTSFARQQAPTTA